MEFIHQPIAFELDSEAQQFILEDQHSNRMKRKAKFQLGGGGKRGKWGIMTPWMGGKNRRRVFKKSFSKAYNRWKNAKNFFKHKVREIHYVDYYGTVNITHDVPKLVLLNGIAEGNGMWNREGNKVFMIGLQLRIDIYNAATNNAALTESTVFFSLVYDKMTQATLPTYNDIFLSRQADGSTVTNNDEFAFPNSNKKDRYKILWSEHITLPSMATGGAVSTLQQSTNTNVRYIEKYFKLGLPINYTTSTLATIAAIEKGGLYLVSQADQGLDATPGYAYTLSSRLTFYE